MAEFLTLDFSTESTGVVQRYLQETVVPRPIALASTIDHAGNVNLSPFSFFNIFSAKPPVLVFSPARRVRDKTDKHTLENVREIPEVVIHVVNYAIVGQASLSSCEYPKGVNEFVKAGFTSLPSTRVKPPRVAESPVAFECKVNEVVNLGTEGGAGHLIICEVLLMHINRTVLTADSRVDPNLLDAVARLGGDYYSRASGDSLFQWAKPNTKLGIGFDQLPEEIRHSAILTGNELAQLANVEQLPSGHPSGDREAHLEAQRLLSEGKVQEAWHVLMPE